MDFIQRDNRVHGQTAQPATPAGKPKRRGAKFGPMLFVNALVLVSVAVLIAGVATLLVTTPSRNEAKFVENDKVQAVFLNGGQVYFGKVRDVNNKFMRLSNIYYLRVNQQVQPGQTSTTNDISLVKLGCELHGPTDSMVINRDQVTFWENLKSDGQVAKAVAEYEKQNPNGQTCEAPAATPSNAAKQ